jgi:hypothetical protein
MLTPEQIAARKGKLTASRMASLMGRIGETELQRSERAKKIDWLYREFIGEPVPEIDLRRNWPVRMGEATENLNLDWFSEKYGLPVTRRGEVVEHPFLNWAACTLDGWVVDGGADYPLEAKFAMGREPVEVLIDRYQPQGQWQCCITGANEVCFSFIIGTSEPVVEYVDRDNAYIDSMIERGLHFMWCVENRVPPVLFDPAPLPVQATQTYDMTGNNEWASSAVEWIATHKFARMAKDAEATLKSLVPEDAEKVTGHGVRITRNRAGRLSLREIE